MSLPDRSKGWCSYCGGYCKFPCHVCHQEVDDGDLVELSRIRYRRLLCRFHFQRARDLTNSVTPTHKVLEWLDHEAAVNQGLKPGDPNVMFVGRI